MPLILALGKQKQVDLCEFESSLVCRVSSRTARATCRQNTHTHKINKSTKYFKTEKCS